MSVRISKQEMEAVANTCGGIRDGIESTGKKTTGLGKPALEGWQALSAIAEVNTRWQQKANHCGGQWRYFGSAVTETAKQITSADKDAAFSFPKVGLGETDVPVLKEYEPLIPPPQPGDHWSNPRLPGR